MNNERPTITDNDDRLRRVLTSIVELESISDVVSSTGVSRRTINGILKATKILVEDNNGAVDELLPLIENWGEGSDSSIFSDFRAFKSKQNEYLVSQHATTDQKEPDLQKKKQAILDEIEADWSSGEMRDLGASLIRLADALDQNWSPNNVQSSFHWPSEARHIERNALELAKKATLLKKQLRMRQQFLPEALLGEPTWNMLLELFCQFAGGASVSTKSLLIDAECPETTALRYINRLEMSGLIERSRSQSDRRLTMIGLTKKGVVGVGRVLERLSL